MIPAVEVYDRVVKQVTDHANYYGMEALDELLEEIKLIVVDLKKKYRA